MLSSVTPAWLATEPTEACLRGSKVLQTAAAQAPGAPSIPRNGPTREPNTRDEALQGLSPTETGFWPALSPRVRPGWQPPRCLITQWVVCAMIAGPYFQPPQR